jgi:hypothetical protein
MSDSRDTGFIVPFSEGFMRSIRPRADVSSAGPSNQPPHGHPFDPPTAPRADVNRAPFRPRSSQEPTSSRAHSAQPAPTYLEGKVAQLNGQVKGHDGRISILEAEKTRLKDVEVDVGRISTLEVEVARLKEVEADVARLKRNGNERDEALRGYLVKEAERRRAALEDSEHLLRICKLPFNDVDSRTLNICLLPLFRFFQRRALYVVDRGEYPLSLVFTYRQLSFLSAYICLPRLFGTFIALSRAEEVVATYQS